MEWVRDACVFPVYLQITCQSYGLAHNSLILHAKICLLPVSTGEYLSASMRQNISICRSLLDKKCSFLSQSAVSIACPLIDTCRFAMYLVKGLNRDRENIFYGGSNYLWRTSI